MACSSWGMSHLRDRSDALQIDPELYSQASLQGYFGCAVDGVMGKLPSSPKHIASLKTRAFCGISMGLSRHSVSQSHELLQDCHGRAESSG